MKTLKATYQVAQILCLCLAVQALAQDASATLEALRAASEAEKVTWEMLRTIKGTLTQEIWSGPSPETSLGDSPARVSQLTFAYDRDNDKVRWSGPMRFHKQQDGAVVVKTEHFGYMYDGAAVYNIQRPEPPDDKAIYCYVHPPARRSQGPHDFNLLRYFDRFRMSSVTTYKIYQKYLNNPDGTRFLEKDGSVAKYAVHIDALVNEYWYDLAKGGNIVRFRAYHPELGTSVWTADYMEVNGVWVFKSMEETRTTPSGELTHRDRIVFDNVSVNVPLSSEEFTPEAIGFRQSDVVSDNRTDAHYMYGSKAPVTAAGPLEDDLVEVREVVEEEPVHSADDTSVLTTESRVSVPADVDEGSSNYAMFLAAVAVAVLVVLGVVVRRTKSKKAEK